VERQIGPGTQFSTSTVLQISPSLSFHWCFMLIHSSITNNI